MTVDNLSEYINTEIDAFGEKNHLIRGLERLLRVEVSFIINTLISHIGPTAIPYDPIL
jgi:hypothetical protein